MTELTDSLHPRRTITVVVNARKKVVTTTKLSFDEVVKLAFDNPPSGENIILTVTYKRGPKENPEGSMVPGQSVAIQEGMVFYATLTDKS